MNPVVSADFLDFFEQNSWKQRLCTLYTNRQFVLTTPTTTKDFPTVIDLAEAEHVVPMAEPVQEKEFCFEVIISSKKSVIFAAQDENEQQYWMGKISTAVESTEDCLKIFKEGTLQKRGRRRKTWNSRHFVLFGGLLCYFTDGAATEKARSSLGESVTSFKKFIKHNKGCKGYLTIKDAKLEKLASFDERANVFSITTTYNRILYCEAVSPEECDDWYNSILECAEQDSPFFRRYEVNQLNNSRRSFLDRVSVSKRRSMFSPRSSIIHEEKRLSFGESCSSGSTNSSNSTPLPKNKIFVVQPTVVQHIICVPSWNVQRVGEWLYTLGKNYDEYIHSFEQNGIDGLILCKKVDEETLGELVKSKLHQKRISNEIKKLTCDTVGEITFLGKPPLNVFSDISEDDTTDS